MAIALVFLLTFHQSHDRNEISQDRGSFSSISHLRLWKSLVFLWKSPEMIVEKEA